MAPSLSMFFVVWIKTDQYRPQLLHPEEKEKKKITGDLCRICRFVCFVAVQLLLDFSTNRIDYEVSYEQRQSWRELFQRVAPLLCCTYLCCNNCLTQKEWNKEQNHLLIDFFFVRKYFLFETNNFWFVSLHPWNNSKRTIINLWSQNLWSPLDTKPQLRLGGRKKIT